VIPIAIDYNDHAQAFVDRLKGLGIRATLDARNETLNYRVREGEMEKVPYMCVIGRREAEEHTVALRVRGTGKKQERRLRGCVGALARVARARRTSARGDEHGDALGGRERDCAAAEHRGDGGLQFVEAFQVGGRLWVACTR
jgi:hypothetical protein